MSKIQFNGDPSIIKEIDVRISWQDKHKYTPTDIQNLLNYDSRTKLSVTDIPNKVAVVLVNWNGGPYTIACIKSLMSGTMKPDKIIVVDNCSRDNSDLDIEEQFPEVYMIRNSRDEGFTGGNNTGLDYLLNICPQEYKYIWVLNNDTEVNPFCLKRTYDFMEQRNDVMGLCGKILYSDDKDLIWYGGGTLDMFKLRAYHRGTLEADNGQYDYAQQIDFITGCSMFVRSSVWRAIGIFDNRFFAYCEDVDWCIRINNNGLKLYYLPEAVIYHKVSASFGKSEGHQTLFNIPYEMAYLSERNQIYLIRKYKYGLEYLILMLAKIPRLIQCSMKLIALKRFDNLHALWKGTKDGIFNKI